MSSTTRNFRNMSGNYVENKGLYRMEGYVDMMVNYESYLRWHKSGFIFLNVINSLPSG